MHYVVLWLVGIVALLVLKVMPRPDAVVSQWKVEHLWIWLFDLPDRIESTNDLEEIIAFVPAWLLLWTIIVFLIALYTDPLKWCGDSIYLKNRLRGLLTWLMGILLLLPLASSLIQAVAPRVAGNLAIFTQPGCLVGIWSAVMFLVFVLNSDKSETHRLYIEPYRAIWSGLIIAVLILYLISYVAYGSIQERVRALLPVPTLAAITAETLHEGATQARVGVEGLLKTLGRYDGIVNDRRASEGDKAQARAQALQELRARVPFLKTAVARTEEGARATLALLKTPPTAANGGAREIGERPRLTHSQLSLIENKGVLDLLDQSTKQMATAVGLIETEVAALAADKERSLDALRALVSTDLAMATGETRTVAAYVSQSLASELTMVSTIFFWLTICYTTFVLFPWAVMLLFLFRKRENRATQIHQDLLRLDPSARLLRRALDPSERLSRRAHEPKRADDSRPTATYDAPLTAPTAAASAALTEQLADRAFNNYEYVINLLTLTTTIAVGWYYVFYPNHTLGVAELISGGSGIQEITSYLINSISPLTFGFVGAYFFMMQALMRRYLADDLYPSAYLQSNVRFLIVFVLSLAFTKLLPTDPLPGQVPAGALPITVAFAAGIFPREYLQVLLKMVTRLLAAFFAAPGAIYAALAKKEATIPPLQEPAPLTRLRDMTLWTEARLLEENVETVGTLAHAPIERLVLDTHFSTAQIVAWVDQAILYHHAGVDGEWLPSLEAAGVVTASDLLRKGGLDLATPDLFTATAGATQPRALADFAKAVADAAKARDGADKVPPESVIVAVCAALWHEENMQYILNFRAAVTRGIMPGQPSAASGHPLSAA